MLHFLRDRLSERKFRLFAVACCRRQWGPFPAVPHRQAIKAAERFADGIAVEEVKALAAVMQRAASDPTLSPEERSLAHPARCSKFRG